MLRRCRSRSTRSQLVQGRLILWQIAQAAVLCGAVAGGAAGADEPTVLTFFAWSDQHVAVDGNGDHLIPAIDAMNALPGTPFPPELGGVVARPAFVFGCGDITEWPTHAAKETYERLLTQRLQYPAYDVIGNHDEGGGSPSDTIKNWLIARHGSLTYSFQSHGVRFIALYAPYDETLNNPAQPIPRPALEQLRAELAEAPATTPTVVATHLCYDALTNRDELVEVLEPYHVIAILGGHYHKAKVDHYRGRHFIQIPSPAPGSPDEFMVFRITPERLVAVSYDYRQGEWTTQPVKRLDVKLDPPSGDGRVSKQVIGAGAVESDNLLRPDSWRPWQEGFAWDAAEIVCDNGADGSAQRGASQTVTLDQTVPEPLVASVWSRAEGVEGSADGNYSLYLDLVYQDGTPLWGQYVALDTGTGDWQRRQVVVVPEKPVRSVTVHLLLRQHAGKARFREPALQVLATPAGAHRFDGLPVIAQPLSGAGFQVRDVAAESDFVQLTHRALELELHCDESVVDGARMLDITLTDLAGRDRAVTLIYSVPVPHETLDWLADPRRRQRVQPGREYAETSRLPAVGVNGRLSRYPLAAVAGEHGGVALGIDMAYPAFYRAAYHAGLGELYLAYDIGLTPEKPSARLRLCQFTFDAEHGFRGALARYYALFPDAFACRIARQGLWMPFARISQVPQWEDFGFRFKEGNDETQWDDRHDILTFRYTEPMTWWMPLPADVPRSLDAAEAHARRLATERGDAHAAALLASGYHDSQGRLVARLLDTPWCDGAVWSMNSMPGIPGAATDFQLKWNDALIERLYGDQRDGDLDGEYIDSSEGYVTDELNFRRDHFACADTPLTFCTQSHRPALFRGLIAFEYVRHIARDVHTRGGWMMANSTPGQLCWLAPLLDVMGTETDWHYDGRWQPMSDSELLYRRAMCRGKPYCFLMNTQFERFSHELVERYMKRTLAYGMFPGFFSHNAAEGHYFTRPELYERDRPLFQRYVPLCRQVAEAGWEPLTGVASSDERVYVERFGEEYLTVFNDSAERRGVTLSTARPTPSRSRDLVSGGEYSWEEGRVRLELDAENVAVLTLR